MIRFLVSELKLVYNNCMEATMVRPECVCVCMGGLFEISQNDM